MGSDADGHGLVLTLSDAGARVADPETGETVASVPFSGEP
jgi:hypothetical protein